MRKWNNCNNSFTFVLLKDRFKVRITYDSEVDALYIHFIDTTVTTQHITECIAVDYDKNGKIAGL